MVNQVEEFVDLIYWTFGRTLDREGITNLQWAFMSRAEFNGGSVSFSTVLNATRQSKDNIRRAAKFLERSGVGTVVADSSDRRARVFTLTSRGRRSIARIRERFQADLLELIGAREIFSERVRMFTKHLWTARGFLRPGDLTHLSRYKKADLPDDSRVFVSNDAPRRARTVLNDDLPFWE